MKETDMFSRNVILIIGTVLILAASAPAQESPTDDRVLVQARGAPANVLLFLDSAATMVNDPATSVAPLIFNGDDAASKLSQSKEVLNTFFESYPEFNMGFSFFAKQDLELHYKTHVYRITAVTDATGTPAAQMHDGGAIGDKIRVGASFDPNHNKPADWQHPILFGADGTDQTLVYDPNNEISSNGSQDNDGNIRYIHCLLDSTDDCKSSAGPPYYYPAYNWGTSSGLDGLSWGRWVRLGLEGARTWEEVADHNGIDTSDAVWEQKTHDFVLADIHYEGDPWCVLDASPCHATLDAWIAAKEAAGETNQIGAETLTYKQWKEVYVGGDVKAWTVDAAAGESFATMTELGHFQLYDRDPNDGDDSQLSSASGTLTSISWQSPGADCEGYAKFDETISTDVRPIVPIPLDGDNTTRDKIKSFFGPQTDSQFYFPTNDANNELGTKYFPAKRSAFIPRTETVIAAGRRPIKKVIDDAADYFQDDVLTRNDEFWRCRRNFVILITDGIETCSAPGPICTGGHAGRLVDLPVIVDGVQVATTTVNVYVIGFGLQAGTNTETLECIADMTGGEYYEAGDSAQLLQTLMAIGREIDEKTRGFSSPTVPSVSSWTDQTAYIATFSPKGNRSIWTGNMRALPVTNGWIQTDQDGQLDYGVTLWNVGEVLQNTSAANRVIYYGGDQAAGSPGDRFSFTDPGSDATATARLQGLMNTADAGQLSQSIAFIRGDRDTVLGEEIYDGWKLGDPFHSQPSIFGAPSCFTCFLRNQNADKSSGGDDKSFRTYRQKHKKRRQILLFGANDGAFHAIDAGVWVNDGTTEQYHAGTGKELFAWIPRAVMPKFPSLRNGIEHLWTVDGSPTVADVYIDPSIPPSDSPNPVHREWRTIVMFGERRGGRSYVGLDLTMPDTYASGIPGVVATGPAADDDPTNDYDPTPECVNDESGCSGDWPAFLWEFEDTSDQDANGYPDLGYTWSRPLVGFLNVTTDGTNIEERSVAVFGGGYDLNSNSGNFFYILDIETGEILFKENAGGMVPGQVAALDLDLDGFFERFYFGTTAGTIRRLDVATPGQIDPNTGRVLSSSWSSTTFFNAGAHQPFFLEPQLVPITFSATGEVQIAVVLGSGRRDNLVYRNSVQNRVYTILDTDDGAILTEADLQPITLADGNTSAGTNYLFGDPNVRGWYLVLGSEEKVNTDALVFNQMIILSTFTPAEEVIVTEDGNCRFIGGARTYVVSLLTADAVGDSRGELHEGGAVFASDSILFSGNDGMIHISQMLDNQQMVEPVEAEAIPLRVFSWKED
jgi:Tfp pilus tip-associated adhesin PilY1